MHGIPTFTSFGRNKARMLQVRATYGNRPKVRAWLIGFGYNAMREFGETASYEHLELAGNLHFSGVKDFKVYASDFEPQAIEHARKDLERGYAVIQSRRLFREGLSNPRTYVKEVFGLKKLPQSKRDGQMLRLKIPEKVRRNIIFLGGQNGTGNVFLESPVERPDFVMLFNVAQHYGEGGQRVLAERIADSLAPGGQVLTSLPMTGSGAAFIGELKKRFHNWTENQGAFTFNKPK